MWNTFTTADPSVSSAATFIPLNGGERMYPTTFSPFSVLFQSLRKNFVPTGWKSWKCPSCSVHCAALHPLFVYIWATSATVYKKSVTFDTLNAPPYPHRVRLFSLSQGRVYSHCIWDLPTPDITISRVVEINDRLTLPPTRRSYKLLLNLWLGS